MKISRANARVIALKLTNKKATEIERMEKELSSFAKEIAKDQIPKEVLELHAKYPGYFHTCNKLVTYGTGLNGDNFMFEGALPMDYNKQSWCIVATVNDKKAAKLDKSDTELKKAQRDLDKLRDDIENALVTLGSYKRIVAEFPDAEQFLPKRDTQDLTVNIPSILKRIKAQ